MSSPVSTCRTRGRWRAAITARATRSSCPWRFHGDGVGAFQNEINHGLDDAARRSLTELRPVVELFRTYSASHVYLLPGAAERRLEDDQPLRDSVVSRMTLVLVP